VREDTENTIKNFCARKTGVLTGRVEKDRTGYRRKTKELEERRSKVEGQLNAKTVLSDSKKNLRSGETIADAFKK